MRRARKWKQTARRPQCSGQCTAELSSSSHSDPTLGFGSGLALPRGLSLAWAPCTTMLSLSDAISSSQ